MSTVDIQFDQSLPDMEGPGSRPIKRLPIFESFTKSDDEQTIFENEYSTLDSVDEGTVNEQLSTLLVDFHVPETVEFGRSFVAVRASQNEGQLRDLMVFRSLLMMFINPKDSQALLPWQQYLAESIRNQKASVINLCSEYIQNFKCEEGHLTFINVDGKGSFDHLNLLMIPNTVRKCSAIRCKFKTMSPWSDLKGKSLECLRLTSNVNLKLDLHGLTGESDHLPLKKLMISRVSISKYFGLQVPTRMNPKSYGNTGIARWMEKSTLEYMQVISCNTAGRKRKIFSFYRDGTWTS